MVIDIERVDILKYPLVNRFYKQAHYKSKVGRSDEVYVAKVEGEIVAAVRLCPLRSHSEHNSLLLRSMVVMPELRRQGVGAGLMQSVQRTLGERVCWCFPFSWLEGFYGEFGFVTVTAEEAPETIRSSYEAYTRQGRDILIMVNR